MKMLRITAKRDGYRRCGVAHPSSPVDHDPKEFDGDQIEILMKDPGLVVVEVDVKPEGKGSKDDKSDGSKDT